jgi:large subunit ribosomal protein L25
MEFKFKAQKREILGKKVSQLRDKGLIPAVIYGHDFASIPLQLDRHSFLKVLNETGETTIIDLEIQGEKNEKVLILVNRLRGKFFTLTFIALRLIRLWSLRFLWFLKEHHWQLKILVEFWLLV